MTQNLLTHMHEITSFGISGISGSSEQRRLIFSQKEFILHDKIFKNMVMPPI